MDKRKSQVVTFGEIMLRLSPSGPKDKVSHSRGFIAEPGGSESNVAVALAQLGEPCSFVTRLPEGGPLSEKIMRYLKANSVDTSHLAFGKGRMGLYWTQAGAGPRASEVFYDRENSSFALCRYTDFDWKSIFSKMGWLHVSGITPALSHGTFHLLQKLLSGFHRTTPISIDLNYRSKLWLWVKAPSEIYNAMWRLCSRAQLILANESDLSDALGLKIKRTNGAIDYSHAARQCFRRLPRLRYLAISMRKSFSADYNDWSGILFVRTGKTFKFYQGRKFSLTRIVDRIGSGDCFAAGIIYGIRHYRNDWRKTLDFAIGLSALKHTVRGDASQASATEVQALLRNPEAKIIR
jgi:2-dehydro-3-deoxygluconokinase